MANIKISDLPAATSVAAGDLFEVSQGSGTLTSRKATGTQVQSFVLGSYAGATSITTLGTVSTGTWQGSIIAGAYGGTGNGFFAVSGPATSLKTFTFPNASATVLTDSAVVTGAQGGTGVANTGKTITLGGNFATSGAYALTLTLTAATSVTLPTTGTLATLANVETLTSKTLKGQSVQYYNSGTTSALDYTNGSHQRWAPTGTVSLTVTNWPASGVLGELLIEGINLGAATITWPTINWIKSDGTTTTTFASNGVTLQSSGTDWVFLWTGDGGTTVYGKIVR